MGKSESDAISSVTSSEEFSYFDSLEKRGRGPAMRRPGKFDRLPRASTGLPPVGVIAFNRMGFGPCPGDLEAFEALGSTDLERLTNYVDQQLDPMSISDTVADQKFAEAGNFTYEKDLPQLWAEHFLNFQDYEQHIRPAREVECATFLRAIFSKRQLFELMVGRNKIQCCAYI